LVPLVWLDHRVPREIKVILVFLVHQDLLGLRVQLVQLDLRDPLVFEALLVHLEHLEALDLRVLQVLQGHQDLKALKVL